MFANHNNYHFTILIRAGFAHTRCGLEGADYQENIIHFPFVKLFLGM